MQRYLVNMQIKFKTINTPLLKNMISLNEKQMNMTYYQTISCCLWQQNTNKVELTSFITTSMQSGSNQFLCYFNWH